jgi:hypothetical protein
MAREKGKAVFETRGVIVTLVVQQLGGGVQRFSGIRGRLPRGWVFVLDVPIRGNRVQIKIARDASPSSDTAELPMTFWVIVKQVAVPRGVERVVNLFAPRR